MPPSVLDLARGFELYQGLVGASGSKRRFVEGFVRPRPGDRVLDLGCGTGALLGFMPEGVEYVGVDVDERYIAAARNRYGTRAEFVCADGTSYRPEGTYDLAVAYGVLHHLDDAQARSLLGVAKAASRFVAAEPCTAPGSAMLERWVMAHDRGRFIRDEGAYLDLVRTAFPQVSAELVPGTYRIPFTLVVLDGRAGDAASQACAAT
jgi:SAM-dependent methyltransferase